jgi:hypothetical protein
MTKHTKCHIKQTSKNVITDRARDPSNPSLSDASSHSLTARLPIIYSQLELPSDASSPSLGSDLRQMVFTESLPSLLFAIGAHLGSEGGFPTFQVSPRTLKHSPMHVVILFRP